MNIEFGRIFIVGTVLSVCLLVAGCGMQTGSTGPNAKPEVTRPVEPVIAEEAGPPSVAERLAVRLKGVDLDTLNLSAGVAEVLKLVESGLEEPVVLAYIQGSTNAYSPPLDELIYLKDLGLPGAFIAAMVQRGNELREQQREQFLSAAAKAQTTPKMGTPIVSTGNQPAPQPAPPVAAPVASPPVIPVAPVTSAGPPGEVLAAPVSLTAPAVQFYEPLRPHGLWVQIEQYGLCWQPSVVVSNPQWRPYADRGRWIYTDCGWYWQSDYAWGWAPFHYGRWLNHGRRGWVWIPDNVWSGAWVSWRVSPTHCGWAPLPPAARFEPSLGFVYQNARAAANCGFGLSPSLFTFISLQRFCDRNPHYFYTSAAQVNHFFHQTTVINNFGTGNNSHIALNHGFDSTRISKAGGGEIRRVSVRADRASENGEMKPERLVREGSETILYRPQLHDYSPARPGVSGTHTHGPDLGAGTGVAQTGSANNSARPLLSAPQPITSTPPPLSVPQPILSTPPPLSPPRPVVSFAAPLKAPPPVTSVPQPLTAPWPVTSTPQLLAAPQPILSVPQPVGVAAQGDPKPDRRKPYPSSAGNAPPKASNVHSSTSPRPPTSSTPAKPERSLKKEQPEIGGQNSAQTGGNNSLPTPGKNSPKLTQK